MSAFDRASPVLPSSSTSFERALADAMTDLLPVPIRDVVDPGATPSRFLPFLAAHESVDLWFDDWPEARKRLMVSVAHELSALKGTRAALDAFLPFVDAEIVDRISHPRRFVVGFSAVGIDPVGHRPFTAHLLVRVPVKYPSRAFVMGRSAIGHAAIRTVDLTPLDRVRQAVRVAKSPNTLITLNYGWRRPVTLDDGFPLDGSFRFGDFTDRKRL